MNQKIFEEVRKSVTSICDDLGYKCVFRFFSFSFKIYGRMDSCGEVIISDRLLIAVSYVPNVVFNYIGIDDNGLYAFFLVSH